MNKRKGFTLIELLVVISIIALLMAILTPALSRAKDQARKVVCTAHMKGLGIALRMYIDDYDGKTYDSPNHGLWDNAWEGSPIVKEYEANDKYAYWGIAYKPYAKNKKIFRCPSHKRVDDWPEDGWGQLFQVYFKYCSYGLNGYAAKRKVDHDFKRHDEVIVFQDHIEQLLDDNGDTFRIHPDSTVNLHQWRPGFNWRGEEFPFGVQECFRHLTTSMTCWLDGHVSGIKESTGEDVPAYWYTGVRSETGI